MIGIQACFSGELRDDKNPDADKIQKRQVRPISIRSSRNDVDRHKSTKDLT